MERRIGIFGGSFDPVRPGHVGLALDAAEQCGLEKVILIPARYQPFKLDRKASHGSDRMQMLRLAAAGHEKLEISDFELRREGVSYTYLTLRAMQKKYGSETRLWFIVGTDSLLALKTWKNAEELLQRYSFIVGSRPGYREDELEKMMKELKREYGTRIARVDNRQYDISSTEIRKRISEHRSADGLVSGPVERYIIRNGLYL